jgi:pimeloyl-ACP methyl ester carboxylesterase
MNLRRAIRVLSELLEILPASPKSDWVEIENIDPCKPTLVLVSGFGATSRNLEVVRRRFKREHFNVLLLSLDWNEISDSVLGLYRLAEKLSQVVVALRKKPQMKNNSIFIVAHSAGGLVARYYIQALGGSHYVNGLITMGTPHQGTWFAVLGFFTHLLLKARCLFQMLPLSPFIRELNQMKMPDGFSYVSIHSKDDLLCPPSVARLPHRLYQGDLVKMVEVAKISHAGFLLNKKMHQLILNLIQRNKGGKELSDDIFSPVDSQNIS